MRSHSLAAAACAFTLLCAPAPASRAADAGPAPEKPRVTDAKLSVSGLGLWRNRELRVALQRLLGDQRSSTLDANAVEDAAFLLMSALSEDGYLKPTIEAELTRTDGTALTVRFEGENPAAFPRPLVVRAATFKVHRGVRYHLTSVAITGLTAIEPALGRAFFRDDSTLFSNFTTTPYSPAHLKQATGALRSELRDLGYAEAVLAPPEVKINNTTGAVTLAIAVQEGPRWNVAALALEGDEAPGVPTFATAPYLQKPWSPHWSQDLATAIRRAYYAGGYPDVRVTVAGKPGPDSAGVKPVAVIARVVPGPAVRVGTVRFEGAVRTRPSTLRSRVPLADAAPLNPLKLEEGRYRLSRLGIFDALDLHYEPATGTTRDPVYVVRETRRWDANLLFGYGSYEQWRAGIELQQHNLFGRAHQSQLTLIQSVKSSRGDYTYTVPGLIGEELDGSVKLFGLRRQELAFLRQEYGGTVTLSRPLPWIGAAATAGYTYQRLSSADNQLATRALDLSAVNAASLDLALTRDRRDNVLRPHRGYRWFVRTEVADHSLGSEVDYQRLEFGGAWHTPWGRSRWTHIGFTHGVVTSLGSDDRDLPVNKRFYPGGENSIRGYADGEAAPRDAFGAFRGAKSYTLLNLELEQAITKNWSLIVFTDALSTAVTLSNYPFEEQLYSAGLGVRYQTLIGPIRVEYGRNIRPRPQDPSGTLQVSLGFPF
ncbi:MAG: BamA/TamA family outer membrane protein [Undibacterium sp.]|nr:BamA/TamA family outer membrane protein [Opitutaceae bacterium]